MKRKKNHSLTTSIKQTRSAENKLLYWEASGTLEGNEIEMRSELMYRKKPECRKRLKAFMKRNF